MSLTFNLCDVKETRDFDYHQQPKKKINGSQEKSIYLLFFSPMLFNRAGHMQPVG